MTGRRSQNSFAAELEEFRRTGFENFNSFAAALEESALYVFELQRFAAEDEGRTEDPTERRQREERQKGNVPRSQDVASSAVLLGAVAALFLAGAYILGASISVFRSYLDTDYAALASMSQEEIKQYALGVFWRTAVIVAPVALGSFIFGIIGNVSQFGLLFTAEPLAFKFERIIPDFKRILPVRRTLYNLAKIMVQVVLISIAGYVIIVDDFIPMLRTANMGLTQALTLFAWSAFKLLVVTALILLALAIPDYFYQRFEYMENLKMTVSEAKRERRDEEGDPMIRQRQRDRGYELRRQRNMLKEVPRADVVVTNPTHFACALRYDPNEAQAPMLIAKGQDHLAFVIRTIARENGVPIEENPQLARVLYRDVEIGQEIPDTLYRVVSMIFARLSKFRGAAASVAR